MSIISQETWDKFTKEEKAKIREKHHYEFMEGSQLDAILLEDIFGKENLQPKPKIRTWEDVKKYYKAKDISTAYEVTFECGMEEGIANKMIATAKIAKLIELGYGGMVTEEEWRNNDIEKWGIVWHPRSDTFNILTFENNTHFITFHTQQQAEEFMSYNENVELVKQYHMQ